MHPISNSNFGNAAGTDIRVRFYDGSALKSGYIVKQVGSRAFVVTDGVTTKTVTLTDDPALGDMLTGIQAIDGGHPASLITDLCTITIDISSTIKYVKKIFSKTVVTTDDTVYSWTGGAASGTIYKVSTFSDITPVNSVLPAITGTTTVGQTLTSSTGTWSNSPSSYTYQWNRDGVAISGATNNTYVLQVADGNKVITVTVNAVKALTFPTAVTSNGTASITP